MIGGLVRCWVVVFCEWSVSAWLLSCSLDVDLSAPGNLRRIYIRFVHNSVLPNYSVGQFDRIHSVNSDLFS